MSDSWCIGSGIGALAAHTRSTVVDGDQPFHPEPGTEALATWLGSPDGGDRRPERVLVKAYYGATFRGDADDREQVWFTTQEGEDLVHLTENVHFKPVPSEEEQRKEEVLSHAWAVFKPHADSELAAKRGLEKLYEAGMLTRDELGLK